MKLVFRFPYQRMSWVSVLSPDEAKSALRKQVGEGRGHNMPFRGKVEGKRAQMSRVVNYRNGFLPVVLAELEEGPQGQTQVNLVMRPPLPTLVFMAIWITGIVAVLSRAALEGIAGASNGIWFVAPIFLFGVALMGFAFGSEAVEAERLLKQTLAEAKAR